MKIYTKTGDTGSTGLLGGRRVSKSACAPEACGAVDELNAELGVVLNALSSSDSGERLIPELRRVQRRLFSIGARLSALSKAEADASGAEPLKEKDFSWMEDSIDWMDTQLKPLQAFILPGGSMVASCLHRARTVCRRAERRIVALAEFLVDSTGCHHVQDEIRYLNRLADYLFVCARFGNHCDQCPEEEWHGRRR